MPARHYRVSSIIKEDGGRKGHETEHAWVTQRCTPIKDNMQKTEKVQILGLVFASLLAEKQGAKDAEGEALQRDLRGAKSS